LLEGAAKSSKKQRTFTIVLSGRIHGRDWVHPVQMTWVSQQSGLSKLWARERIADLSRQLQLGGERERLRSSILDHGAQAPPGEASSPAWLPSMTLLCDRPGPRAMSSRHRLLRHTGSYWATTGFAKTATPAGLLLDGGLLCLTWRILLVGGGLRRRDCSLIYVTPHPCRDYRQGRRHCPHRRGGSPSSHEGRMDSCESIAGASLDRCGLVDVNKRGQAAGQPWPWADTRPLAKLNFRRGLKMLLG